jgi:hypothetical protein
MPVKGIERVRKGFKQKIDHIADGVSEGAVFAILSQGAGIAQTMTPIDTSNLVNSQYYPQMEVTKSGVKGNVGYTAAYAAAVHEAPGTLKGQPRESGGGDYWDPNAEPGFLKKGFEEVKPAIPAILKQHYRV